MRTSTAWRYVTNSWSYTSQSLIRLTVVAVGRENSSPDGIGWCSLKILIFTIIFLFKTTVVDCCHWEEPISCYQVTPKTLADVKGGTLISYEDRVQVCVDFDNIDNSDSQTPVAVIGKHLKITVAFVVLSSVTSDWPDDAQGCWKTSDFSISHICDNSGDKHLCCLRFLHICIWMVYATEQQKDLLELLDTLMQLYLCDAASGDCTSCRWACKFQTIFCVADMYFHHLCIGIEIWNLLYTWRCIILVCIYATDFIHIWIIQKVIWLLAHCFWFGIQVSEFKSITKFKIFNTNNMYGLETSFLHSIMCAFWLDLWKLDFNFSLHIFCAFSPWVITSHLNKNCLLGGWAWRQSRGWLKLTHCRWRLFPTLR